MLDANDAIWRAKNQGAIDDALKLVAEEFDPWEVAPDIQQSTEIVLLGPGHHLAIDGAASVLLARLRNMIVTIIYSQSCGCRNCRKRIGLINPVYTETLQALRCLQSIKRMNTVVAVASDTNRQVVAN